MSEFPASWDLVIDELTNKNIALAQDMKLRDENGQFKYGKRLEPFDGKICLPECYEEVLDAIVYIRTEIYEREYINANNLPAHNLRLIYSELLEIANKLRSLYNNLPAICPVDAPAAPAVKVTVAPALPPKIKTFEMVFELATTESARPLAIIWCRVPVGTTPAPAAEIVGLFAPIKDNAQLRLRDPKNVRFAGIVTNVPVVLRDAPTMSAVAGIEGAVEIVPDMGIAL